MHVSSLTFCHTWADTGDIELRAFVILTFPRARRWTAYSPKMVQRHHVQGYESFLEYVKDLKAAGPIYVLYTGTKLPNGKSWCSDCVEGECPCLSSSSSRARFHARYITYISVVFCFALCNGSEPRPSVQRGQVGG